MFSRDFCITFFEPTSIGLSQRLQTPLSLFPIWNIVVGIFLTVPACMAINKYGEFMINLIKKPVNECIQINLMIKLYMNNE